MNPDQEFEAAWTAFCEEHGRSRWVTDLIDTARYEAFSAAWVAAGLLSPPTPTAGFDPERWPYEADPRKAIEAAISYPLRHSEIADFRYETMIDNLVMLVNRVAGRAVRAETGDPREWGIQLIDGEVLVADSEQVARRDASDGETVVVRQRATGWHPVSRVVDGETP